MFHWLRSFFHRKRIVSLIALLSLIAVVSKQEPIKLTKLVPPGDRPGVEAIVKNKSSQRKISTAALFISEDIQKIMEVIENAPFITDSESYFITEGFHVDRYFIILDKITLLLRELFNADNAAMREAQFELLKKNGLSELAQRGRTAFQSALEELDSFLEQGIINWCSIVEPEVVTKEQVEAMLRQKPGKAEEFKVAFEKFRIEKEVAISALQHFLVELKKAKMEKSKGAVSKALIWIRTIYFVEE